MCGIVGVFGCGTLGPKKEKLRQRMMVYLATELMNITEERGKDASGLAATFDNGEFAIIKSGMPSPQMMTMFDEKSGKTYKNFLKLCRENGSNVRSFIGHCRKASVGNTWDNVNNHPIRIGDIIGVHNGTLKNHDRIFELLKIKRDGDVDSESIFRLFNHFTNNAEEPFTLDLVKSIGTKLDGSYAVIVANSNNPYQIALMRDGRPMDLAILKGYGIVMISSEKKFIERVLYNCNMYSNLFNMDIPETNFSKDSVVFGDVSNMNGAILDLTEPIDNSSIVSKILKEGRITCVEDVWKDNSTTTTTYQYGCNRSNNFNNKTTEEKKTTSVSTPEKTDITKKDLEDSKDSSEVLTNSSTHNETDTISAMIWDRNRKKFTNIARMNTNNNEIAREDISTLYAAEVSVSSGTIKEIFANGEGKVIKIEANSKLIKDDESTTETNDNQNRETLLETSIDDETFEVRSTENPAIIQQFHMGMTKGLAKDKMKTNFPEIAIIKGKKAIENKANILQETEINKDALEKAYNYSKNLALFSSDEDLATQLEVSESSVRAIPAYALSNRVNKTTSIKTYYDGFIEGLKSKTKDTVDNCVDKNNIQMHIRVLKHILDLILCVTPGITYNTVDSVMSEKISKSTDLTSEKFYKVMSPGDVKKHRILKWISDMIIVKEGNL
jgi:amidophosphoribosyltransferase